MMCTSSSSLPAVHFSRLLLNLENDKMIDDTSLNAPYNCPDHPINQFLSQMMLRRNPHQHPLIYMRGMKSSDLASILDFIYFGEIEMSQV